MPRTPIIPPALKSVHDRWHFAPAMRAAGLIVPGGLVELRAVAAAPA